MHLVGFICETGLVLEPGAEPGKLQNDNLLLRTKKFAFSCGTVSRLSR